MRRRIAEIFLCCRAKKKARRGLATNSLYMGFSGLEFVGDAEANLVGLQINITIRQ